MYVFILILNLKISIENSQKHKVLNFVYMYVHNVLVYCTIHDFMDCCHCFIHNMPQSRVKM